jgi:hypothetical protein
MKVPGTSRWSVESLPFDPMRVSRPRTAPDAKRASQWLVWAVLAVIFARGPVPWVHTHESLAHLGHSEDALAWHLSHFHAPGEGEHGWHIHWTLPWEIVNCPCQHDTAAGEEIASTHEMPLAVAQSTSVHDAVRDSQAGAPPPIHLADRDGPPRWDHRDAALLQLSQTPSSRVTLRALLCVAQC